ncbi:hypothetical protein [Streptomyces sp. NPDC059378]|uniref:hypothetical protein n=1 Tax=unclassified Streptomyces TaxID=2593676 RepID=UPI00365C51CF
MIQTRDYLPVVPPGRPEAPCGISLDVPILRKRTLRDTALAALHDLLRAVLRLEDS